MLEKIPGMTTAVKHTALYLRTERDIEIGRCSLFCQFSSMISFRRQGPSRKKRKCKKDMQTFTLALKHITMINVFGMGALKSRDLATRHQIKQIATS